MHTIVAYNVNDALRKGLDFLQDYGTPISVRGQSTIEAPGPVTTVYRRPLERVLFSPLRDANHFFHFFEALWILAGRDDVEFVSRFNSRIHEFSDNWITFHGAYGFRLRRAHRFDQIDAIVHLLRRDPSTRRAVMTIWMPNKDANVESNDIPCNTTVAFLARSGVLNMTVFCRSNDLIWGQSGANAVQFSMLQEVIAALVGVKVGIYYQISNSYHVYDQREDWKKLVTGYEPVDHYKTSKVTVYPMVSEPETFLEEVMTFVDNPERGSYTNRFFEEVARPLWYAWKAHKKKKDGLSIVTKCKASDWDLACSEWLERREIGTRS